MQSLPFSLGNIADFVRKTAHDFAIKAVAPRAHDIDQNNEFPKDLWPKLGALGLLGITVEEEYGGSGMGYLEYVIAMEEPEAIQCLGGNGHMNEYPTGRFLRDAKLYEIGQVLQRFVG